VKRLLLLFISFAFLPFIPAEARACSCVESNVPICAAFWRADAVFAGQLLDITPVEKKSDNQMPTVMLHFIVEQPFRGVAGNRVDVETLHGTSCDMPFKKGERYLIYAGRDQDSKQLFAGPCMGTTNLKHAVDDLNYIRTVTQQQAKETILGRLLHFRYDPLPGNKVTVHGSDKTFETKTDENGDFSVSVPGPGKYTVRVFIPYAAEFLPSSQEERGKLETTDALTTFEYEVQVARNQCQYRQLDTVKVDLHATAEVSGSVLTAAGRAVSTGYVYLVHAADFDRSEFVKLDEDGSFKFEGVAVGEYYVVLNPRNEAPDDDDPPYPRTYYPNAPEVSAATKIVVTEGAKLENLTLRVGRPWKERVVSGKVVWQDGQVPKNAHVSLYDADRYVRLIKLDEKGRFDFKVYGDFKYVISATVWGQTRGQSERISITDKKSTGLTLVLKPVE
jgi:hypothetical protein